MIVYAFGAFALGMVASTDVEARHCRRGFVHWRATGECVRAAAKPKRIVAYKRPVVARAAVRPPVWYDMQPSPLQSPYGRIVLPKTNYDPYLAAWASLRLWRNEP